MRPSPGIVNGHSTRYCVFVLGQSLDVDIVEKLEIRQIRKCPDENRPTHLYRMVESGGIPYHGGYGARARTPGMGDGRFLARPNAVRPAQPAPPGFSRLSRLSWPSWPSWPSRPSWPSWPSRPSRPSSPSRPTYKAGGRLVCSTASRGAQAGCVEGWVPPSRTPEERGCSTREQWQCQRHLLEISPDSRECPQKVRAACGHRARSHCTPRKNGCQSNSHIEHQLPQLKQNACARSGRVVGRPAPWRYGDTADRRRTRAEHARGGDVVEEGASSGRGAARRARQPCRPDCWRTRGSAYESRLQPGSQNAWPCRTGCGRRC